MTREEIEIYGKILDNKESRKLYGLNEHGGGTYSMFNDGDRSSLILMGRLGAIRYIKQLNETVQKITEKLYNKTKEE